MQSLTQNKKRECFEISQLLSEYKYYQSRCRFQECFCSETSLLQYISSIALITGQNMLKLNTA